MSKTDDKMVTYLNTSSTRTLQVIFAARHKAGERGSAFIDVGGLIIGLIVEDQGTIGSLLSSMHGGMEISTTLSGTTHSPVFSPQTAAELLTKTEDLLPRSDPISHTIELPLSPDLRRVFDAAKNIQNNFHHERIEPLHLLGGILRLEPSVATKLLIDAGITKELVVQRLAALDS